MASYSIKAITFLLEEIAAANFVSNSETVIIMSPGFISNKYSVKTTLVESDKASIFILASIVTFCGIGRLDESFYHFRDIRCASVMKITADTLLDRTNECKRNWRNNRKNYGWYKKYMGKAFDRIDDLM